jgi:arylsulfatase A-like enzyme
MTFFNVFKKEIFKGVSVNRILSLYLTITVIGILILFSGCTSKNPGLNVVLISIDTLRADHLGCYGYHRNTSSNIDRFANRGVLFEKAFSHSPKTTPSHMSMFTSLYPTVHRVFMPNSKRDHIIYSLDDKIKTLAEILEENGYTCVAFTGGGHVGEEYGFGRGFKKYITEKSHWKKGIDWISSNSQKKFFIFFHTYVVHDPYLPPDPYYSMFNPGYQGNILRPEDKKSVHVDSKTYWEHVDPENREDIKQLMALYDGEILYMDEQMIKPLFAMLKKMDLFKNTIIIFTSDHGEEFKEHGRLRHDQVYDEHLHVPLIIYLPPHQVGLNDIKSRIQSQVRLIDIMPTIIDLLKIRIETDDFQGTSLVPVMKGVEKKDRLLYASRILSSRKKNVYIRHHSLRYKGFKLIQNIRYQFRKNVPWELYNISDDPQEKQNLILDESEAGLLLKQRLSNILKKNQKFLFSRGYRLHHSRFKNSNLETLRALGYL